MTPQIVIEDGKYYEVYSNGIFVEIGSLNINDMISPVTCSHCRKIYDLCDVKVVARYSDCTQFKTPCCDVMSDDREWKSLPDFKKIDKNKLQMIRKLYNK